MTTWPSGLRRVTRNHFSSGGVGSNPAVVVFLFATFPTFSFYPFSFIPLFFKKVVLPRFELGSLEPESNMLPLHHRTMILVLLLYIPLPFSLSPLQLSFFKKQRAQPDLNQWPRELQSYALPLSYAPFYFEIFLFLPNTSLPLFLFFPKKRLPWGSNPRPYG